jgi:hypothetical protein
MKTEIERKFLVKDLSEVNCEIGNWEIGDVPDYVDKLKI